MNQQDSGRARRQLRQKAGVIGGYIGFGAGLMSLLTTSSEGTPFAPNDAALLVLGFMIAGYVIGWLLGPVLSALFAKP